MNKVLGTSLAVAGSVLATLASVSSAQAVTIATDGTWQSFTFGSVGSTATPTFQFTLADAGTLDVTDAFQQGDIFEIFNFGSSLGKTSDTFADGTNQIGANPDAAFVDPLFSHGSFSLAAGIYDISIKPTASPFGAGGAYLRVQPVPVPAIIPGAILAGLYFGSSAIRRKKTLKTIV